VWLDESRQRYLKTTFPGKFGFTVITNPAQVPDLADGTPLEYLERLLLQNSLFGDLIELEGIAQELGQTVILTSQPHITGMDVSREDIQNFMARQWFKPLNGLQIGRPGALAFYRDLDEVAAFDAHPGNFVKDTEGRVLPIDLILLRADDTLQKALARFLD
jgi:hypothetical protein